MSVRTARHGRWLRFAESELFLLGILAILGLIYNVSVLGTLVLEYLGDARQTGRWLRQKSDIVTQSLARQTVASPVTSRYLPERAHFSDHHACRRYSRTDGDVVGRSVSHVE